MPIPFLNEKLLQFIWQHQYLNGQHLTTVNGEIVVVHHPGLLNCNQGPDFLNARITIGDTQWAGNVELHLKTSDYYQHKHQHDDRYNNVVLHVVWQHDDHGFDLMPVLELQPRVSNILMNRYAELQENRTFVACAELLNNTGGLTWNKWKERLVIERLQQKAANVLQLLSNNKQHWEEVFWTTIARNFGYKVNADLFSAMALSLNINILAKHKHQQIQLEALMMGQANLLNEHFRDDYATLLLREFKFLKQKHQLRTISILPSFLRMRPANFPTIRLSQLAALVYKSSHLFSVIKEVTSLKELQDLFKVTANDYWHYHYRFDEATPYKPKVLGSDFINNIIINTIVPILFTYAELNKQESLKDKALEWLNVADAEVNTITKGWEQLGVGNKSAADSQFLIQLKNNYCNTKRCLECAVGNAILKVRNHSA